MFNEEISDIISLSWMKIIDNHFVLLIIVGIWARMRGKQYGTFGFRKTNVNFELLQTLVN
jgi:hypothetical protein